MKSIKMVTYTNLKLSKNDIKLLLSLFCLVLEVARYYFDFLNVANIYYLIVFLSLFVALYSFNTKRLLRIEIAFFLLYEFVFFASIFINQNLKWSYPILSTRYIFLALVLGRTKLNKKYLRFILSLLQVYYLCIIITRIGTSNAVESIFGNMQNTVSVHLILFNSLYLLAYDKDKSIEEIILTGISFVISLIAGGRAGIIALTVLLLVPVFVSGKKLLKQYRRFAKYLLLFLIAIVFLLISRRSIAFSFLNRRMEGFSALGNTFFHDSFRSKIIADYFAYTFSDLKAFIFGAKLDELSVVQMYGGNPHNSYIYLYAHCGLIGMVLVLYFLTRAFIYYYKIRDRKFLILLCIVLRAYADIVAFPGIYDVMIWYFILEVLSSKSAVISPKSSNCYGTKEHLLN